MNPELQTLVDRLELVERQNRNYRILTVLALVAAGAAMGMVAARGAPVTPDHGRFSVVEADRFLLRDVTGGLAGGLESTPDGTIRLVLGGRGTPSAHVVVRRGGDAQLTLRSPDGQVRAALTASDHPALWLMPDGASTAAVTLGADAQTGGEIAVNDGFGRPRFHAP